MPWPPPLSARWTALALFLMALGLHLFVAIAGTVGGLDFRSLIILDELGAILLAPLVVALVLRLPLRDAFLLRSSHWGHYLVAGAAAIPLQLFGGSMQEVVLSSMPGGAEWRSMLEEAMEPLMNPSGPLDMALLLFGGVALAAICEEILFRGLLLQLLAIGGRLVTAIGVTAVLFGLFHLDPIGLLPRTLMGIYFALLVWRSGSIFPAMLAHGANNLLAFAALPLADPTGPAPSLSQASVTMVVSGLIFAAMLAVWLRMAPTDGAARLRAMWWPRRISEPEDGPRDSDSYRDSSPHTDPHGS